MFDMKILCIGFILICLARNVRSNQDLYDMFTIRKLRIVCSRGLPFWPRLLEIECCNTYEELMKVYWHNGDRYLSEHMEFLRTWRCPQFQQQCDNRTFDFNEFTSLVYDRFCNKSKLERRCTSEILDIVGTSDESSTEAASSGSDLSGSGEPPYNISRSDWSNIIEELNEISLTGSNLVKPCVQVAQLDSSEGGFGSFQELFSLSIPFCSIVWCGYSRATIKDGMSLYDCMSQTCKANVIILVVVIILLSLAILVANSLVIIVFCSRKRTQNAQGIFKICIAAADFLTGLLIMPSFAINLISVAFNHLEVAPDYILKLPEFANQFVDWDQVPMQGRDGVTVRAPTTIAFSGSYIDAFGCVTVISLLVSIYSLALASIDRLLVVYHPLRYRRFNSKKVSARLCILVWIIAIILALLPFMRSGFSYTLISAVVVTMIGENVEYFYIVALAIPILTVWISTILLYVSVRKQARKRKQMASQSVDQNNENKKENRLAVTLVIMVGVFTISMLPITILSIVNITTNAQTDSSGSSPNVSRITTLNSVDYIVAIVLMCNSLWNVFIYTTRNKDFKDSMADLKKRARRRLGLPVKKDSKVRDSSSLASSSRNTKTDSKLQTRTTTVSKAVS